MVSRLDLEPPVNIEELLRARAEVHRVDWPHKTVDAILLKLSGHSPSVYLRATDNLFRERFTMAHELGHLMLPWHLPRANCAIGTGNLDLEKYSVEDEADIFASCLLIPDAWLLDLLRVHGDDMSEILRELNSAEVTTIAGLRALRRVLISGWIFVAYNKEIIATPGTSAHELRNMSVRKARRRLESQCYASGEAIVNDFTVRWYQMFSPAEPPERDPADGRTLHQQLVDAISMVESDEHERTHLANVCNGKVGGLLREASGRPATETFSILKYRFESSHVAFLLEQPDFISWLAEKARTIEAGDTKAKKGRRK
ncbi:ImmA/IrrE family metallo-endopeptidase [Kribbella pittospori]|uniref:ImmA/IrrE family metallo-endopeptidase n=1 Tax=Kribbella pittospori TaxID=722689 RepID=UPI00307C9D41